MHAFPARLATTAYLLHVTVDPFAAGELPSQYPEAAGLPAVRQLLAEQVDMQFADMRALLRLPQPTIAPDVGCNLTMAAMVLNQISGFSIWFFHNRYAQVVAREEAKRRRTLSGKRFLGFVRAYYPRAVGEPRPQTVARHLYRVRNLLAHELGVGDLSGKQRRREIYLVKPDPPLDASDVVDLETRSQFPLAGVPIRLNGASIRLYIPGLYWSLGQMLRAALTDQPARCERRAEDYIAALPVPRAGR